MPAPMPYLTQKSRKLTTQDLLVRFIGGLIIVGAVCSALFQSAQQNSTQSGSRNAAGTRNDNLESNHDDLNAEQGIHGSSVFAGIIRACVILSAMALALMAVLYVQGAKKKKAAGASLNRSMLAEADPAADASAVPSM